MERAIQPPQWFPLDVHRNSGELGIFAKLSKFLLLIVQSHALALEFPCFTALLKPGVVRFATVSKDCIECSLLRFSGPET